MSLIAAHELVEAALGASTADDCIVIVRDRSSVNLRFAVNTTTSNGSIRSRSVTVLSFVRSPAGTAVGSINRFGAVDVDDMVAQADAMARRAPVSSDAAELLGGAAEDDFEMPAGTTDHGVLQSIAAALGVVLPRAERSGITVAGFAEHEVETTYLGSSTGIRRRFEQPTGIFQLNGRADGGRRSAWTGLGDANLDVDVDAEMATIERRLAWAERSIELPAGRYETILPPIATADLMIYLYWVMSGRDALDGKTVFSKRGGGTKIGERLSDLPFTLRSDPKAPGLSCLPFVAAGQSDDATSVFDNGATLEPTAWIEDGVLERLLTTRADAERHQMVFSPWIDNLALELPGATASVEEMVASTERGLLLTSLWYIRMVDPATALLTGLTRDGVYLIEDGEIRGAVNNFRFNESPVDLLSRAVEAGASVRTNSRESGDEFNRTAMAPLRIPGFNMSSVSPAN